MSNRHLPIVTFEQAKKLKDAGFDWPTRSYFPQNSRCVVVDDIESTNKAVGIYPAPTVAVALKWMRDVHNLSGEIIATASGWQWQACKACRYLTGGSTIKDSDFSGPNDSGAWYVYEDCEKSCVDELLKIV